MYWRDIGYLCNATEHFDKFNKPYYIYERREVYCNTKGVKRSEFYQAQAQGYKPEICVEIKEQDYNRETHFEYNEVMYRIIRTYPVKNEAIELICQSLVAENV